jgi:hypothetical protein
MCATRARRRRAVTIAAIDGATAYSLDRPGQTPLARRRAGTLSSTFDIAHVHDTERGEAPTEGSSTRAAVDRAAVDCIELPCELYMIVHAVEVRRERVRRVRVGKFARERDRRCARRRHAELVVSLSVRARRVCGCMLGARHFRLSCDRLGASRRRRGCARGRLAHS